MPECVQKCPRPHLVTKRCNGVILLPDLRISGKNIKTGSRCDAFDPQYVLCTHSKLFLQVRNLQDCIYFND